MFFIHVTNALYFIYCRFQCFPLPEPSIDLLSTMIFAKTPFPLTRGFFKTETNTLNTNNESTRSGRKGKKTIKKVLRKKIVKGSKKLIRKRELGVSSSCQKLSGDHEKKYICSICKKKQYKYRRNKLRHEKYECVTGPQFVCDSCGKKYSQKKTLTSHIALKHPHWIKEIQASEKKQRTVPKTN